jgi:hypothetical protein
MLAMAMLGDASLIDLLHPLTDSLAQRLGLGQTLPPKPAFPPQRRARGIVLAGDRLIRLLAAGDPTQDEAIAAGETRRQVPQSTAPAVETRRQVPPSAAPALRASPRPAEAFSQPPAERARRSAIPEQYLQPWEFRRSREEAIYAMHDATRGGWLRLLLRALRAPFVSRREFFRWQIMLSGKPVDDQLWGVRPPAGGLGHRHVRDWAARTLALAGYDPTLMLSEWEIYWRRKAD